MLLVVVLNLTLGFTIEPDANFNIHSLKMTMDAFAEDDPPDDPYDPNNPFPKPNSPYPPYDTLYIYKK